MECIASFKVSVETAIFVIDQLNYYIKGSVYNTEE